MKKKNIMVFTAARSDFGIMKNTIIRLNQMKKFNFFLVIGSAHTSKAFGNTIKEINKIKIKNKIKLNFDYSKNSQIKDVTRNFTNTMISTQNIFDKKRFDCCLIMGDRYEMIAVAIVCLNNNVPIAHICGGSETYGSIDNEYRNSISQMANFHFVETNHHKKRLKNMGINRNIHVVGAPALENLKFHKQNFSKIQEQNLPNFNLKQKLVVSCFHPETTTNLKNNLINLNSLIKFLNSIKNYNIIFTYPNADTGYKDFIDLLNKKLNKNIYLIPNLGVDNYYSILKKASCLIGNSSSGIIESASFNLPTINLGNRQKKRYSPKNVYHCPFKVKKIKRLFNNIIKKKIKIKNPYFKKNTSQKITTAIKNLLN